MNKKYSIYLAGPDVFLPNAREVGLTKKVLCEKYGFKGLFPIDNDIKIIDKDSVETALEISACNEQLIRSSDLIIANITPFRGPSADVGTVYEIGFGKALGIPIYAYSNTMQKFTERTLEFLGKKAHNYPLSFVDKYKMEVENWNMVDNLMVDGAIKHSGGRIVLVSAPEAEKYSFMVGFERCLYLVQQYFNTRKKIEDGKRNISLTSYVDEY